MKLKHFALFLPALVLAFAASAMAQTSTFSDPNVEYTFEVPDPTWKMTAKPSVTSPNVEYTYEDRTTGYMEVRKITVKSDDLTADAITDEEEKLKFLQGYIAGKQEIFTGRMKGVVFNYEFIRAGRNMSGRLYFLRANPTTIYVIRFTGRKEKLITIRNQTDLMARTFDIKKS